MSTEKTTYRVTVSFPPEVSAKGRTHAGITVDRVEGYVGPLTKEQLGSGENRPPANRRGRH